MKNYVLLTIATALVLGSCGSTNVKSDYDRNISFNQYKTYEIRQNVSGLNDIDKNRVISAIKQQLSAKGMRESASPDVVIGLKETTQQVSDIETIAPGGWGWRSAGFSDATVNTYDQGTLILSFIDNHTQQLIWQGTGSGLNVDNPASKAKQIPAMVSKMLSNYPPGTSTKK
ncbi:DUF4136 domain-containing protein [Elizabethkingia anophelis]|uniref:DUF4136 domain-containing protein n=1 Tax=Elizabethkingia anophelis TaxID=1117645 RepID=UPI00136A633A|nr:DUF4136 domain-containing protein [Elizabethkingia anophelis]MYY27363.1 DUF4136 domain-containing protein [Elizabethkingia anophelis]